MLGATDSSNHIEVESDPTLSSLVPQRSRGRSALLLVCLFLGTIGIWTSHGVLRPTVVSDSLGSTWMALPPHDQVATMVLLDPSGWSRNLQSVTDVPGAQVAGAWLLPQGADLDAAVEPAGYDDGLAYLEAGFPAGVIGENSRLPQRVPRSGPSRLVVLWDITDCTLLEAGPAPQAEIHTWLGTTVRQSFDDFLRPGANLPTLAEVGICPRPGTDD